MNSENKHKKNCTLVVSLFEMSFEELAQLKVFSNNIGFVEIRADVIGHRPDYEHLSKFHSASLLYALRSQEEGGFFQGTPDERKALLIEASKYCDLIELEGARDLQPEILEAIPPEKRIISWHGLSCSVLELEKKLKYFDKTPAQWYRLVPQASKSGDGLIPLLFLKKIGRKDVISFASKEPGQWTQIIAPYLGAQIAFGTLIQNNNSTGTFSIAQLIDNYNLQALPPFKRIFGIVGNPIFSSRSPQMHNNAYWELSLEYLYLPFHVNSFNEFWDDLVCASEFEGLGFSFNGFTVVSPFKEEAINHAGKIQTPIIRKANACNVLVKQSGIWESGTTDFFGLESALEELELKMPGLKVAIIGCGGAGRTIAAGLTQNDANVLLVNRSLERAQSAAKLLQLPFVLLADFFPRNFDLIINATPLGKHSNEAPFNLEDIDPETAVIDLTYSKGLTALVRYCMEQEMKVISGRKILLFQVLRQFELLTRKKMPYHLARTLSCIKEEEVFLTEIRNINGFKKQSNPSIQESRGERKEG